MSQTTGRKNAVEIKGNTLRVYLYLLQNGPSELRDVQRALNLSTPSLASYHLAKLVDTGCAVQDADGRYVASTDSTQDVLEGFVRVGVAVVPQLLFFAVLFTPLTVFFAIASITHHAYLPLLIAVAAALVGVLWYETLRIWKRLASWK